MGINHFIKNAVSLFQTPHKFIISQIGWTCKAFYEHPLKFSSMHKKILLSFADLSIDFSVFLCYNVDTKEREAQTNE